MKFKRTRESNKKQRKAQGHNAIELRKRIAEAIRNGFSVDKLIKRGLRRGYAV